MPVTQFDIGSDHHQILLEVASTVYKFFSRYTTATYLDTRIHDYQIVLNLGNNVTVKFWIEDTNLVVWESQRGIVDYLSLPYTKESLRRVMRTLAAKLLVKFLEKHQEIEVNAFAYRDWGRFTTDRTGSIYDGWNFNVNINGKITRATQYKDYVTFWGDPGVVGKIIERASGIKANPHSIILQKSTPLSTDGLMAKIDKWLDENI